MIGFKALKAVSLIGAIISLYVGTMVLTGFLPGFFESQVPGPFRDLWRILPLLEATETGDGFWSLLAGTHGGHRPLIPRLFYLADYTLGGGQNSLLYGTSLVLQGVSAFVLWGAVRKDTRRPALMPALIGWDGLFAFGLIAALLFSFSQYENIVRPWNVHWYLCNTAVIVSLACLQGVARACSSQRSARAWWWWSVASLAAWSASFSMANGLFAWPVLCLVGWMLCLPRRFWAGIAVQGLLTAILYMLDFSAAPGRDMTQNASERLIWFLKCLGAPLSYRSEAAGVALGLVGTLAAALLIVHLLKKRQADARSESLLVGLLAFSFASLVLVALARLGFAWDVSRYQSLSLLFWLSLVLLGLRVLPRDGRRGLQLRAGLIVLTSCWLLGALLPEHNRALKKARPVAAKTRSANTALLLGVKNFPSYEFVMPQSDKEKKIDRASMHRDFLRERRLGVFASMQQKLIGSALATHYERVDASQCEGVMAGSRSTVAGPTQKVIEVEGRILNSAQSPAAALILVTNRQGVIIGLGRNNRRHFDPLGWGGESRDRWEGFVLAAPREIKAAWAISKEGEACPIRLEAVR